MTALSKRRRVAALHIFLYPDFRRDDAVQVLPLFYGEEQVVLHPVKDVITKPRVST